MNLLDAVHDALRALRANALRSGLTTLGIIIGVAAVIVMVAVGKGAERRVAGMIQSLGANLLVVMPGSGTGGGARLGQGTRPSLTDGDAAAIALEVAGVTAVAPLVRGSGQAIYGSRNWNTMIYGTTPEYLVAREWEVDAGRTLTTEDVKQATKGVLLGRTVCDALFPDQDPVGEIIRVRRVPLQVIGVLRHKGQTPTGIDQDDVILLPISTARMRVLGGASLNRTHAGAIVVKVAQPALVRQVEAQVTSLLRDLHRLRLGQEDDFVLRNLSQIFEAQVDSSRTMALLLATVASVSLIVGGIGIMNIMLVSVTERTREIGLRLAVGARGRDILIQFLMEAATLAVIGGIIGVAIGLGGVKFLAALGQWPTVIDIGAVGVAFGFSGAVGLFFGYYPARKAARLKPIEALRYE